MREINSNKVISIDTFRDINGSKTQVVPDFDVACMNSILDSLEDRPFFLYFCVYDIPKWMYCFPALIFIAQTWILSSLVWFSFSEGVTEKDRSWNSTIVLCIALFTVWRISKIFTMTSKQIWYIRLGLLNGTLDGVVFLLFEIIEFLMELSVIVTVSTVIWKIHNVYDSVLGIIGITFINDVSSEILNEQMIRMWFKDYMRSDCNCLACKEGFKTTMLCLTKSQYICRRRFRHALIITMIFLSVVGPIALRCGYLFC